MAFQNFVQLRQSAVRGGRRPPVSPRAEPKVESPPGMPLETGVIRPRNTVWQPRQGPGCPGARSGAPCPICLCSLMVEQGAHNAQVPGSIPGRGPKHFAHAGALSAARGSDGPDEHPPGGKFRRHACIAQLDRAPPSEGGGPWFKSKCRRQNTGMPKARCVPWAGGPATLR